MLNFLSLEVLHPDSGQRPCQGGIQISNELSFLLPLSMFHRYFRVIYEDTTNSRKHIPSFTADGVVDRRQGEGRNTINSWHQSSF